MSEKVHPNIRAIERNQDLYWRTQYATRKTEDLEAELAECMGLDEQARTHITRRYADMKVTLPPDFSSRYTLAIASLKQELFYRRHYVGMTM